MKIPIINRKGGVAKSTTTINLGAALAQASRLGIASRGYCTVIVDMDPQASTSFALTRGAEDEGLNLGHVLIEGVHIEEAIRPTTTPTGEPADSTRHRIQPAPQRAIVSHGSRSCCPVRNVRGRD